MPRAPRLRIEEVDLFERDVRFRMPFRFGVVTLSEAPQIFVRLRIRLDGPERTESWGTAADLLAPKWFDKDPNLSNEQNFKQLRDSLAIASKLYRQEPRALSAFGHHVQAYWPHLERCAEQGLNPLIASFGQALIDRAVLDALGRALRMSVFELIRRNFVGLDATLTPDLLEGALGSFDIVRFLGTLGPSSSIEARHTVGLLDPVKESEITAEQRLDDGLPQSLEACIERYGLRCFKLKLEGERTRDIERLTRIAALLDDKLADYRVTLDGNEQYDSPDALRAFLEALEAADGLDGLRRRIAFIEQPIRRQTALSLSVAEEARHWPLLIDESDASIDVFPQAREQGYTGISSKACKGVYRALLNRARCAFWNAEAGERIYFMSAEDLTTQPGIALQQDLALATLIGCEHVERNGHHYVDGMRDLPESEQGAFLVAHPDLYHRAADPGGAEVVRLKIEGGLIRLQSLRTYGFASGAMPDFEAMRRLEPGIEEPQEAQNATEQRPAGP